MVYIDTQWAETGSVPQAVGVYRSEPCRRLARVSGRHAAMAAYVLKTRIENRGDISMEVGLGGTVLCL